METRVVNTYRAETVHRKGKHRIVEEFLATRDHPYWYVTNVTYDEHNDIFMVVFKEMSMLEYHKMKRDGFIIGNTSWY